MTQSCMTLSCLNSRFPEEYKKSDILGSSIWNENKSLNDKLKGGGLNIGLNDKIAFIKHLFEDKSEDYDRVLSQLNTFETLDNALSFIQDVVKPDYNNWQDKEEFETRFLEIIAAKFN